ncbi:MAG: VOC family protein [Defluviitaleaceae bacterium]|nr:VOC family protein [Defluviitaleaceae bacterium]
MKTRLAHVRANVRDLQKAIDWYTNVLGFEVGGVYPATNPTYAQFADDTGFGGACFSIMVDENVPSHGRFNFNVEDLEGFWSFLKDKVEVIEPLFTTPYGSTKFTIRDLDGNELGFAK